jgi:hypothetical protein
MRWVGQQREDEKYKDSHSKGRTWDSTVSGNWMLKIFVFKKNEVREIWRLIIM